MQQVVVGAAVWTVLGFAAANPQASPPLPSANPVAEACGMLRSARLPGPQDALRPASEDLRLIHVCPQPPPGDQPPAL